MLDVIASLKEGLKASLFDVFGPSDALLHANVGLAFFVAAAILLRRKRLGIVIAWAVLCVLQIGNEVVDGLIEIYRHGHVDWGEALRDCIATLFWPTILMLTMPLFHERWRTR